MSNYLTLTKVLLKNANMRLLSSKKGKKRNTRQLLLMALLLLAFIPMILGIGTIVYSAYPFMAAIQQEGLVLAVGFSVVCAAVFFFSIFYTMSVFYFSGDIESLLALPLKPSEILAAKFTVTLFYEYLTEIVFLAPVLIGYGLGSRAGFLYYLYSIIAFAALPVIPLIYASLLSIVTARYTNLARNKDRFRIIGGIAAMFLALLLNFTMQRLARASMDPQRIMEMAQQGNNSLVQVISGLFFTNRFLVTALINTGNVKGIVNLLIFLAITILLAALFAAIGEGLYFKGVIGVSEAAAGRKRYSQAEYGRALVQSPVVGSYLTKELRLLFRTPAYFMNCVLMNFLWPLFILIPFIAQPDQMRQLGNLGAYIRNDAHGALVLAIAFGASLFINSTNGITASAISREGKNLFICKYIPVSYKKQLLAKVLSGVLLGMVGLVVMLLAAAVVLKLSLTLLVLILICGLLGVFFGAFTGILLDLHFPKLVWENEQKAVKQNMNLLLNMLLSVIVAGITIFATIAAHAGLVVTFIGILAVFGIADAALYALLSAVGAKIFGKIEA